MPIPRDTADGSPIPIPETRHERLLLMLLMLLTLQGMDGREEGQLEDCEIDTPLQVNITYDPTTLSIAVINR